ncbi:MAG: hypothetical protein ACHQ1G_11550 [Planctomycetota bacterium]
MRRVLLWALVGVAGACATARPPPTPDQPEFPTVQFLRDHEDAALGASTLAGPTDAARLPFSSAGLWTYVLRFSEGGNDCPDGQLDSDCAHFQAHALAAAGIRVEHPTATCRAGLTVRVKDLAIAFDNASRRYANVKKFRSYRLARRGDFCFLPRADKAPHDHMMLLAAEPDEEGARVYSHTNNRVGTYVEFGTSSCLFFRIEE